MKIFSYTKPLAFESEQGKQQQQQLKKQNQFNMANKEYHDERSLSNYLYKENSKIIFAWLRRTS